MQDVQRTWDKLEEQVYTMEKIQENKLETSLCLEKKGISAFQKKKCSY